MTTTGQEGHARAQAARTLLRRLFGERVADLDSSTEEQIIAATSVIDLAAGETLVRKGEDADRLFLVQQGKLEAVIERRDGGDQFLAAIGPGDLIGEVALLAGGTRSATVRAATPCRLTALARSAFADLVARHPEISAPFVSAITERLRHSQVTTYLTRLFGPMSAETVADMEREVRWRTLTSGEVLCREGDPGDCAYIVISGRLRVTVARPDGSERVVNEAGRGEIIGEMALLTGEPRSASLYAIRDTDLAEVSRSGFDRLMRRYPEALVQIARLIVSRLQQQTKATGGEPNTLITLAVARAGSRVSTGRLAEELAAALSAHGETTILTSSSVDHALDRQGIAQIGESDPGNIRLVQWLSSIENRFRYIIYQADDELSPWTQRCLRQADRILWAAESGDDPALSSLEGGASEAWQDRPMPPSSLVLLHPDDGSEPRGTARWLSSRNVESHFHLRLGSKRDIERLARTLTGRAVSLVLGGGGARAAADLGVLRALEEAQVSVDLVGGTSMGAIMAAFVAMRLSSQEATRTCERRFASLFDYTLPIVALLAGRRIYRQLSATFEDRSIEDLWLPYFCVSTSLTRAEQHIHRSGALVEAIRASISLPGVMPPYHWQDELLIDGGLLNNLPIDVMRSHNHGGQVVAVDVTPEVDIMASADLPHAVSGWSLLWRRLNPFAQAASVPHILNLLTRATVVPSIHSRGQALENSMADLYLRIPVEDWKLLDFSALGEIAQRGFDASWKEIRAWRQDLAKQGL